MLGLIRPGLADPSPSTPFFHILSKYIILLYKFFTSRWSYDLADLLGFIRVFTGQTLFSCYVSSILIFIPFFLPVQNTSQNTLTQLKVINQAHRIKFVSDGG